MIHKPLAQRIRVTDEIHHAYYLCLRASCPVPRVDALPSALRAPASTVELTERRTDNASEYKRILANGYMGHPNILWYHYATPLRPPLPCQSSLTHIRLSRQHNEYELEVILEPPLTSAEIRRLHTSPRHFPTKRPRFLLDVGLLRELLFPQLLDHFTGNLRHWRDAPRAATGYSHDRPYTPDGPWLWTPPDGPYDFRARATTRLTTRPSDPPLIDIALGLGLSTGAYSTNTILDVKVHPKKK